MKLDLAWIDDKMPGWASVRHLDGPGFVRFGPGMPDAQLVAGAGGTGLLLRNGWVDPLDRAKQNGTVAGRLRVAVGGAVVIDQHLEIPDGCGEAWSVQGPRANPPESAVNWLLRDCNGWPKEKLVAVREFFEAWDPYFGGKPGYDLPEPDVAGSPRMTEYAWAGALGAAFLARYGYHQSIYRAAAADWTRLQFRRPYGYYSANGEPWRLSYEPDSWLDEKGWRKAGHGKIDRPSACLYQAADPEHLTIDREWTAAVLWNDPLAWILLDHIGEAVCSWPACRSDKTTGNLRAYARTIKVLALLVGAFGEKRPQFKVALRNAYSGLRNGCGWWDIPYAVPSPPKAVGNPAYTHVSAQFFDIAAHPEWTDAQAAEAFRAVIVPWCGLALNALDILADIPEAEKCVEGLGSPIGIILECLKVGRLDGTDNNGQPAVPAPFHDSYAWKVPGRVKRANIAWGGTMDWCAPAMTKEEAAQMKSVKAGLSASVIENYWPMLGLIP